MQRSKQCHFLRDCLLLLFLLLRNANETLKSETLYRFSIISYFLVQYFIMLARELTLNCKVTERLQIFPLCISMFCLIVVPILFYIFFFFGPFGLVYGFGLYLAVFCFCILQAFQPILAHYLLVAIGLFGFVSTVFRLVQVNPQIDIHRRRRDHDGRASTQVVVLSSGHGRHYFWPRCRNVRPVIIIFIYLRPPCCITNELIIPYITRELIILRKQSSDSKYLAEYCRQNLLANASTNPD